MSYSYSKAGPGFVPEFQISGLPFVTSSNSAASISFPYLTQWILVRSSGSAITMAFTPSGFSTGNRFILPANTTLGPLRLRITDLHFSGSGIQVMCGLTQIDINNCYVLVSTGALTSLTGGLAVTDTNYFAYRGI